MFMRLLIVLTIAVLGSGTAMNAETIEFTGGGTTTNWSDGGNWSNGQVPRSGDSAAITAASPPLLVIDVPVSMTSLAVAAGAVTTIIQNAPVTTSGDFMLDGGTWSVTGTQSLSVGGALAIAPIPGLFAAGCGAVTMTGSSTLSNPANPFSVLIIAAGRTTNLMSDIVVTRLASIAGELAFNDWATLHLRGSGNLLDVGGDLNAIAPHRGTVLFESATTDPLFIPGGSYGWCQLGLRSLDGAAADFEQTGSISNIDSFLTSTDSAAGSVLWDTNSYDVISSSWLALGDFGSSPGATILHAGSSHIAVPALCWATTGTDQLFLDSAHCDVGEWAMWDAGIMVDPGTSTVSVASGIGPFWTTVSHDFYNLQITGSCPLYGPISVGHDLTVATGGTLTTENLALVVGHDLTVLPGGAVVAGSSPITVGADITIAEQDGAFQANTSQVTLTGPGTLSDADQANAFYQLRLAGPGATVLLSTDITTTNHGTVIAGEVDFHNGPGATWHLQGTGDVFTNQGSLWAGFGNGGFVRYENASSTIPMSVAGTSYGWASLQLVSRGGAAASFEQAGDITAIDDILTMVDTVGGSVHWKTNSHRIDSSSWMAIGNWGGALGGTTMDCGTSDVSVPAIAWFSNPDDIINLQGSTWTVGMWGAWNESAVINPDTSTIIASNDLGVFWSSIPQAFHNLVIDAPASAATAYGDLTVTGTLSVSQGSLVANGHVIVAEGTVAVAPSATLEGQTVELASTGAQTVTFSPTTSIARLQIDGGPRTLSLPSGADIGVLDVAAGPTVRVGTGSTLSAGSLLLNGSASLPITMQSSQPGNPWFLTLAEAGTQALAYVAAQDSNASHGLVIDDTTAGTDLGGNTNWQFSGVPPAPTFSLAAPGLTLIDSSSSQSTPAFAVVTSPLNVAISFQVTTAHATLFSALPAIDSTGTLTFTPAGAPGTTTVTVIGYAAGNPNGSAAHTFNITLIPPSPTFSLASPSITVADTSGPQTDTGFATITSPLNATVTFQVTATTPSLFSVAPGISSSGTLTFTPAPAQSGTSQVTVVGFSAGNPNASAPRSMTITVMAVTASPILSVIPSMTVAETAHPAAQRVPGFATVVSPIPDQVSYIVTYANASTSSDPTVFTIAPAIDAQGTLTYTLEPYQYGVITLNVQGFSAGNPVGSSVYTSTLTVSYVNQAPRFTMNQQEAGSLNQGESYTFPAWTSSIEVGPLSEQWQTSSFMVTASNPGLFLVPPNIDQHGTLTFVAGTTFGTSTVSVAAHDGGGTANGGVDTTPTQTFLLTVSMFGSQPVSAQVTIVSYSRVGASEGVTISHASVQDLFGHVTSVPLSSCRLGLGFGNGSVNFSAGGYAEVSLPTQTEYLHGATVAGITVEQFTAGEVTVGYRPDVYVGPCLTCQTKGTAVGSAAPAAPQGLTATPMNLRIDNQRQDLISQVTDYAVAGPGQGSCHSCDTAGSPVNELPALSFSRIHRYQDISAHASFGPGVYSNFDLSLNSMAPTHITLWDPACAYTIIFTPTSTPGHFTDTTYRAYQSLSLVDAYGFATNDPTQAATATLLTNEGSVYTFEIIPTVLYPSGRLVSQADRNGAALTLSYVFPSTATLAQLSNDTAQFWKIAAITDAYGRQASVTYAPTALNGQWPIQRITQPNGGTITYTYGDGSIGLSHVQWSNGDQSTFSANSAQSTISIDDAAAMGEQRHQTITFTQFQPTMTATPVGYPAPWSLNRVSTVTNGAGELAYGCIPSGLNDTQFVVFTGGNAIERLTTSTAGLPLKTEQATSGSIAQPAQLQWYNLETYPTTSAHNVASLVDAVGGTTAYQLNAEQAPIGTTYPDGSTDSTSYNSFKEPLHAVDRTGNITDYTYDANGNLLQKTVAGGTAIASTWSWQYNPFGQVTQATDANGNITSYVYNTHHFLIQRIDPADVPGGPQSVSSYTYDAAGRLATSTDASNRTTSYTYDVHDRLITVTYADGSTEITSYGTGELSQLVVSTTDRNGHVTTFGYDAAGRKISQTSAAGLPEAVIDTWTYLPGTDLVQSSTHNGNDTDYTYDYRNRLISTTVHPSSTVSLATSSTYDEADRLIATEDPYGRETYMVYDANDRVIRTVVETVPSALPANPNATVLLGLARIATSNASYLITDTTYDAEGRTLSVIDPRGISSARSYDGQGRLSAEVEASGTSDAAETSYAYDAQGNIITVRLPRSFSSGDPIGYATSSSWTGRNLLMSRVEAIGRPEQSTTAYTYTPTGKQATVTDANGNVITDIYEPCCDRLFQMIDALGGTTTCTYDAVGNTTAVTDPNGNTSTMTYDGLNRRHSSSDGAGDLTRYAYDDNLTDGLGIDSTLAARLSDLHFGAGAVGSAVSVTDPTHGVTITIADGSGRTVRVFDPNANASSTVYDLAVAGVASAPLTSLSTPGVVIATAMTDALDHTMTQYADGAGRMLAMTDALTQWTVFGVDADGNQLTSRDPNQVGMTCSYDNRNRRTLCIDTQGDSTASTYDSDGNVLSMTDGQGALTTATFDGRDRRVTLTDRIAATTTYTYDGMNHVLTITDAEGGVTAYGYDARNLLIRESFPGAAGGVRTYGYDVGDRLATRLDQAGILTTYRYDSANRLSARQYPDSLNDLFTYDASGRVVTATSMRYQNTVTRSYDPAGRLMDESISVPGSPQQGISVRYDVNHGYDTANREVLTSYPDSSTVTRTFTARNQLASVSYAGSAVASRLYDLDGRLLSTTYGNGKVESRSYRGDNSVATMGIPGVTGFSYQYDHDKRKVLEMDSVLSAKSQQFTYDQEGRITGWVQGGSATRTWTLSPVGDWSSTITNGVLQQDGHNGVHEMTTMGSQMLTYDSKGNLTTDASGNAFTWDVENRLAMSIGSGSTTSYQYDALGRRVSKSVNGLTTTLVSAGNQEVWEVDTNQSVYSADGANGGPGTPSLPAGGILSGTNVIRIDFQTAAASSPTGYAPDTGEGFGIQADGLSYGWTGAGQPDTHEYTSLPLQQYDGNDNIQPTGQSAGTWTLNLPNGTYPIVVVMGDAGRRDMTNNVTINAVNCADPNPDTAGEQQGYEAGRFVGFAVNATVNNGTLMVTAGSSAVNPRICFIEVGANGTSIDSATQTRLANLVQTMTAATAGTPPKLATRSHVYGSYIDEPLLYVDNGTSYYIHSNDLYSVAALTDSTGAVVERYSYDAYGRQTVEGADGTVRSASSYAEPWGFTGRRGDAETGLMYFRARMYSPELGRFVGRDPAGYMNGQDLYRPYFIPSKLDPSGKVLFETDVAIKSYIAPVGNNIGAFTKGMITQYGGVASDDSVALYNDQLQLMAGLVDGAFSEKAASPDPSVMDYRIFSEVEISYDCCNSKLSHLIVARSKKQGIEPFIPGFPLHPPAPTIYDRNIRMINQSTALIGWSLKGRPNAIADIGMTSVAPRVSVYIWHKAEVVISCQGNKGIHQVASFTGSMFPSHKLWINGQLLQSIAQGPLVNLWHASAQNPTMIK